MPISSLTSERVDRLLKQKSDKQDELNAMLKLSTKDIWNRDLNDLEAAWEDVLEGDRIARSTDLNGKKKGPTSKFAKANRKRVSDAADGEYQERKPKIAKTKANASPRTTQSKITSFTSKPTESKGAKAMHTAAFTSVNKAGTSASITAKKETFNTPISYDDDDFDALVAGLRPEPKPITIDLLSPETAVKPKKTFTIPAVKKPSFAAPAPKPRAVSKSKSVKRKIESDDEDEFSFMADNKSSPAVSAGGRRPSRAAASKAKTIVLTSDDIFDESEEDDFDEEEDD